MTGWASPDASPEQPRPQTVAPTTDDVGRPQPLPPLPVPFAPMSLPALLDGAVNVLKRRPREVLLVSAVFVVAIQLLVGWFFRDQLSIDVGTAFDPSADPETQDAGVGTATAVVQVVSSLRLLFPTAVLSVMIVAWMRGEFVSAGTASRALARRTPALLAAWVVVHVIEVVAVLALVIGMLVATIFLQLVTPVMAVEGLGVFPAIRRSYTLVRARFGRAITVPAALWVIQQVAGFSLQALALALTVFTPDDLDWVALTLGTILLDLIFLPIWAAAMALLYIDTRIRVEGFDLQDRAARAFDDPVARTDG